MGLRHLFGEKPVFKALDFLRVHRDWDYPLSQIEQATGVSYRTLQSIIPRLVEAGLLKETREVGKAKMYAFNTTSRSAKKLDELATAIDLEYASSLKTPVKAVARLRK